MKKILRRGAPVWILGAPDPEMSAIEALLREQGEQVAYATLGGARVHPGNAYRADAISIVSVDWESAGILMVECDADRASQFGEELSRARSVTRIDHHRPGDSGYGRPPAEFLAASSIGQVLAILWRDRIEVGQTGSYRLIEGAWWYGSPCAGHGTPEPCWHAAEYAQVPDRIVMLSAADHCLGAAYQGECPGVDPDDLMAWRVRERAKFQRRSEAEVLTDVEQAREMLHRAPRIALHQTDETVPPAADLRGGHCPKCLGIGDPTPGATWCIRPPGAHSSWEAAYECRHPEGLVPIPELPEAAARDGIAFMGRLDDRGRIKTVLQVASPEQIRAWMSTCGLTDIYGDPERGFAGGYDHANNIK